MAPTGVAAIQVDGTTIRTFLGIPVRHFGTKLPPLHDKMKYSLRNHLSDLKVIIIDQISMVSNKLLFYVHLRLNEIVGSVNSDPFAGVTVGHVHKYEAVLWTLEKLRKTVSCYKNDQFFTNGVEIFRKKVF